MNCRHDLIIATFFAALATGLYQPTLAADAPQVYPAAILPFQERGREVKDLGRKVSDLLFADLVTSSSILLVDREDLDTVLKEQELNLSGMVNPQQATKVGQLTGAKLLITGSVLQIDNTVYLVAKVIGTETSRVLGTSVKGNANGDLGDLAQQLAEKIGALVEKQSGELVAKPVARADRIAKLNKEMGKAKRPVVQVRIPESHIGQATIDPAAETEVVLFCKETGFEVLDAKQRGNNKADVLLQGEAFSEFATRHGNLISVKARLELKAIDRSSGKVLAVDRQTSVAVDLTEHIAAKTALQQAGAAVAERLLPKIARTADK